MKSSVSCLSRIHMYPRDQTIPPQGLVGGVRGRIVGSRASVSVSAVTSSDANNSWTTDINQVVDQFTEAIQERKKELARILFDMNVSRARSSLCIH
eukprot:53616-Eustigmatos_ZCMA.PRE.1